MALFTVRYDSSLSNTAPQVTIYTSVSKAYPVGGVTPLQTPAYSLPGVTYPYIIDGNFQLVSFTEEGKIRLYSLNSTGRIDAFYARLPMTLTISDLHLPGDGTGQILIYTRDLTGKIYDLRAITVSPDFTEYSYTLAGGRSAEINIIRLENGKYYDLAVNYTLTGS
ncbi:MAG: hypothetical protein ACYCQJ_15865 [Nitrososphaerales archaeon]